MSCVQALEARMKDRTDGLQKALAERAEKEAADITAILTELQQTIQDEARRPGTSADDVRSGFRPMKSGTSLSGTSTALRARVQAIPGEIEKETEAIKARFADPQPRMFPVAVTYLVPEKMART